MTYVWASVTLLVAAKTGWTLHGMWADWQTRRKAQWVTITLGNGARLSARVDALDWARFFDVESFDMRAQ